MTGPIADPSTWMVGAWEPPLLKANMTDPLNTALADTGWQSVTVSVSGFTITSGGTWAVRRVGAVVHLAGQLTRATTSLTANSTYVTGVSTLPSGFGFAPSSTYGPFGASNGANRAGVQLGVRVNNDRTIDIRNTGSVDMQVGDVGLISVLWLAG